MRKVRCSGNRERIESDDLLRKLMGLLLVYRGTIRVTILKNIALVTYGLITLFQGARGGNGGLERKFLSGCGALPGTQSFAFSAKGGIRH